MSQEKIFDKYRNRGSMHWFEMTSRDIRKYNAFQQARYDWILKVVGDVMGKKILDLGCGDGALSYVLARRGADVVGIDNEPLGIEFAEKNLASKNHNHDLKYKFVVASAYELPFPDQSFDFVVHCEVIEHLQQPEKMLAEASRVLKRGGLFILTTPHRLTESPHDPNHVREFFPGQIKGLLEPHFSEVTIKLTHHVFWYGLYSYTFRRFGNRHFGQWFLNIPILLLGWNPFMIDYEQPTKFDIFTQILAWGRKQ